MSGDGKFRFLGACSITDPVISMMSNVSMSDSGMASGNAGGTQQRELKDRSEVMSRTEKRLGDTPCCEMRGHIA